MNQNGKVNVLKVNV